MENNGLLSVRLEQSGKCGNRVANDRAYLEAKISLTSVPHTEALALGRWPNSISWWSVPIDLVSLANEGYSQFI